MWDIAMAIVDHVRRDGVTRSTPPASSMNHNALNVLSNALTVTVWCRHRRGDLVRDGGQHASPRAPRCRRRPAREVCVPGAARAVQAFSYNLPVNAITISTRIMSPPRLPPIKGPPT